MSFKTALECLVPQPDIWKQHLESTFKIGHIRKSDEVRFYVMGSRTIRSTWNYRNAILKNTLGAL